MTHESNGIDIITALILNDISPLCKYRMDLVLQLKVRQSPGLRQLLCSSQHLRGGTAWAGGAGLLPLHLVRQRCPEHRGVAADQGTGGGSAHSEAMGSSRVQLPSPRPSPAQDNASKLLLALMESRHDSENAERILISLRPQELVRAAGETAPAVPREPPGLPQPCPSLPQLTARPLLHASPGTNPVTTSCPSILA